MKLTLLLFFLSLPLLSRGQSDFQHTMVQSPNQAPCLATLDQVSWLTGRWEGEALGGIIEEIWSAPSAGSMMCAFKLIENDEVKFYELATITEENNSLIMRLKHFNHDLTGWEDKQRTIDFILLKIEGIKVYFDGLTFEKISDNEMTVYVLLGDDQKTEEVAFTYKRS